ncbi:aminotransferase class V-fold PLP-dependent enzyme, partial [Bacillus thuringiensis]|nr:aminotransferase class V-fold PLP-dependent enzyme [Bacillus thuringiensis]
GEPDYKGGGTVNFVTDDNVIWGEGSSRDEAGTPNLLGVIALLAAIDEINKISYRTIEKREEWLTRELLRGLNNIGNIDIYGYPYYDG